MVNHASSQTAISASCALRARLRSGVRNVNFASCCVMVLPPPTPVQAARAIPRGSTPQCERNRRSSIARKASGTCDGSVSIATGSPTMAPLRAIGVPSLASSVTCGGATG